MFEEVHNPSPPNDAPDDLAPVVPPLGSVGAADPAPPAAPEAVGQPPEAPAVPSAEEPAPTDEAIAPLDEATESPAVHVPAYEADERESVQPISETVEEPHEPDRQWYILKVQSNREESIREGLLRRVAIAGLDKYFGEVIVPTEMVSEFKGGKKRIVKRKLYPGYLVVNMEINEETWFLVRETPGIGDFTGAAGKPSPMQPHEIAKIVAKQEEKTAEAPKLKISLRIGDRAKITDGTFENFEGTVDAIDEANGRVTVMINIFGRSTPVELEYWQLEGV